MFLMAFIVTIRCFACNSVNSLVTVLASSVFFIHCHPFGLYFLMYLLFKESQHNHQQFVLPECNNIL